MASENMPNLGLPITFVGTPHIDSPKTQDLNIKCPVDTEPDETVRGPGAIFAGGPL